MTMAEIKGSVGLMSGYIRKFMKVDVGYYSIPVNQSILTVDQRWIVNVK